MTKVTIGGQETTLPPMTVRVIRLVLPRINQLSELVSTEAAMQDPAEIDRMMAMTIETLACWLTPPPRGTAEEEAKAIRDAANALEDRMLAGELATIGPLLKQAVEEQGITAAGESPAPRAAADEPSTSNSTPSSAPSSPPASPEEPGIA